MADNFKYVQMQATTIAGAGSNIGDTSLILTSFKDIGGVNLAMTDFGSEAFGTLEPGNGIQEEQIAFTGITQNGNGTATLTGVSTVLFKAPYTQTSGLAKTHVGGATFVISNTAGFYDAMTSKSDDETITGLYTFTQFPVGPSSAPTTNYQFSNKKYVDDSVAAGVSNMSLTTFGGGLQASAAQINAGTANGPDGGSVSRPLVVNPSYLASSNYASYLPTSDQKAALAGQSGTAPSASNKFLDNAYGAQTTANLDTTTTLGTSDTKYPSQKAVKTYVDTTKGMVYIGSGACGTNATVTFAAIATTYQTLVAIFSGVTSGNNAVVLQVKISSDNGSSYGSVRTLSTGGNSVPTVINGKVDIYNIGQTSTNKIVIPLTTSNGTTPGYTTVSSETSKTGVTNNIQFLFDTASFNGGTIYLYGI